MELPRINKIKIGKKSHKQVHGIYRHCVLESEIDDYTKLEVESLEEEIKICKLRLARAMKAEKMIGEDKQNIQNLIRLKVRKSSVIENVGVSSGVTTKKETEEAVPEYSANINMIINQLVKLSSQQQVLKHGSNMTPENKAAYAREALIKLNAEMSL